MLYFQRRFFDAIRSGAKTQTVRLWKFQRVKPEQSCHVPGLGRVRIESVEEIDLAALTADDARLDGFESLAELRQEIARLYPDGLDGGRKAWRVRFRLET
jgi:hypothetical protein